MNNLVPTPIVNKNGVHTTVYKAAEAPNSSPMGNLPAPTISGVSGTALTVSDQIMRSLAVTFEDSWINVPRSITQRGVLRRLEMYPEETQRYIREIQELHPEDHHFDRMLISMIFNRDPVETVEDTLYVFNALLDQWDNFTYDTSWIDDRFDVAYTLTRTVNGVKTYGGEICAYGTEGKSLRHYDQKTRDQVSGLVALYTEMTMEDELHGGLSDDDSTSFLADQSTIKYVAENPQAAMKDGARKMVDEMLTYHRTDWDLIQSMKNAPSAPLNEGTL